MTAARLTAGILGLLLLAGCGFHLRKAPDLPLSMRHIYIAMPGSNGSLLRELRRDLTSSDTEVLPTPLGATTTLSIIDVTQTSQPVALNTVGQPLEYQVTYHVEFSLSVQDATILEPQVVDLKRNYTYSITNAIANEEQEKSLTDSLSRDVAQFIIYRVIAAARSLPPSLAAMPVTAQTPAATGVPPPAAATRLVPAAATQPPPV